MAKKDWVESVLDDNSSLREFTREKNDKLAIIVIRKDPRKKDVMLMLGDNEVEDLSSWSTAERIANKYLNYIGEESDAWYFAHGMKSETIVVRQGGRK